MEPCAFFSVFALVESVPLPPPPAAPSLLFHWYWMRIFSSWILLWSPFRWASRCSCRKLEGEKHLSDDSVQVWPPEESFPFRYRKKAIMVGMWCMSLSSIKKGVNMLQGVSRACGALRAKSLRDRRTCLHLTAALWWRHFFLKCAL